MMHSANEPNEPTAGSDAIEETSEEDSPSSNTALCDCSLILPPSEICQAQGGILTGVGGRGEERKKKRPMKLKEYTPLILDLLRGLIHVSTSGPDTGAD
ncbi:hypothetical protein NQZ68_017302 [Dissostichus eleginoides]|nr:hypothetical protein NQZ68_017302 [Dissostichus eleginoides]